MAKGNVTRNRILETALRSASVGGLEGITLGKVAAEVGMSKSGLFAHFDSKETLQVDVLNAAAEKFAEVVVAPALTAPRGEPRLRALFDRWMVWEQHESLPGGCVFMHASAELDDRPGPARDVLVDHQRRWMGMLAKAVRMTIEAGHFRADVDSELFAFQLYGIVLSYYHSARLFRDPTRSHEQSLHSSRWSPRQDRAALAEPSTWYRACRLTLLRPRKIARPIGLFRFQCERFVSGLRSNRAFRRAQLNEERRACSRHHRVRKTAKSSQEVLQVRRCEHIASI